MFVNGDLPSLRLTLQLTDMPFTFTWRTPITKRAFFLAWHEFAAGFWVFCTTSMTRHVYFRLPFNSVWETAWLECKVWQKVCGPFWLSALPADLYCNPASAFVAPANAKRRQKASGLHIKVSPLSFLFYFIFLNTKQTVKLRHWTLIDMAQRRLRHLWLDQTRSSQRGRDEWKRHVVPSARSQTKLGADTAVRVCAPQWRRVKLVVPPWLVG